MKKISLSILTAISLLSAEDLKTTIQEVLSTNPIVLERLKNYNSTKEDIDIANSGYYPKLDLVLGIGYEHTELNDRPAAPDGSFDFAVYDNSLTLTQNIFKGFETTYQVKEHENRTIAAAYHYVEKVNSTAFEMVNQYLLVLKQNELLANTQENIDITQEILEKVEKLYDSGLTTLSEVNKIQSSLSLANSNYLVQENNLKDAVFNMHKVFGRHIDINSMTKPEINFTLPKNIDDAVQFAIQNNPSLLVSKHNIKLAQATHHKNKSSFYPQFDIEVSQNFTKNLGASEGERNRFRAMAFVKYNLFNGFADTAALQKSISEVHKEVYIKDTLRRETIDNLALSWVANEQLTKQLEPLLEYKDFAQKTLDLYKKEYDLGRRSLLDLLSAQNDFINSKDQIINAQYSAIFAKYRILDSLGTLVTTILGDSNVDYSNVGLVVNTNIDYSHVSRVDKNSNDYDIPAVSLAIDEKTPQNSDVLPLFLDKDTDLIVNDRDICNNSLNLKMRNIYGCEFTYEDTLLTERYRGFLFEGTGTALTQNAQERLDALIKQVEPYDFEYLKFDLLGNADDEKMSKEEMLNISRQRAQVVKDKLIDAGAKAEHIVINALSDEAPMYTNGLYENEGVKLNNRVDIIVRKLIKDSDEDGVFDSKDKCPNTPKGSIVDEKGCVPDNDSDSDGVLDSKDECPKTPEGISVDEKGCELDSDEDGVLDSKDKCPDTAKGFKVDDEGCPKSAILEVNFPSNGYEILPDLDNDVKKFADFLLENPGYKKVIIRGHTDSSGDEAKNKILSQNRANSVKEALIVYGVSAERLATIGKGSIEPIASNETPDGRAQNRRIEVELIK